MGQKFFDCFLIALCVILLVSGITMLGYSIIDYFILTTNTESQVYSDAIASSRSTFQGVASTVLGVMSIVAAVCGFAGVHLKRRSILTMFVACMTVDIVMRILLLIFLIAACARAHEVIGAALKEAFNMYGASVNKASTEFNRVVDNFTMAESCCNWGITEEENVYINTEWYKLKNAALSRESPQTLPEHCCTTKGKEAIDLCIRANDLRVAQAEGNVHEKNCLDIVTYNMRIKMYIWIISHSAIVLFDALATYFAMKIIKANSRRPETEKDSLDSSETEEEDE